MKKFELFKKECLYWIDRFQLSNWGVNIAIDDREGQNVKGYIKCDDESFLASIFFCADGNKKSSEEDIKDTAKHEVIHLLLARMSRLGEKRYAGKDELYAAEEEIVQRLLKIIK